jgi:hypothetical protein
MMKTIEKKSQVQQLRKSNRQQIAAESQARMKLGEVNRSSASEANKGQQECRVLQRRRLKFGWR